MLWFPLLLAAVAGSSAVPAADDLSVIGVVVATQPSGSAAVIRSRGQTRVVGIGESAFGGRVAAISYESVALDFAGTRVDVRVRAVKGAVTSTGISSGTSGSTGSSAPVRASSMPATSGNSSPDAVAKQMSRDEVMRRIGSEASKILAETAIAPAMADGKVSGLTLTRLPSGSTLLTDAGLQVGDVLTQINGTPVDGLPSLMGLWNRLQGEKTIQAVVLRGGQPLTLTVNLH